MPVPYNPMCLMHGLNTEMAPVTETVPFNTVRLMIAKIWYPFISLLLP